MCEVKIDEMDAVVQSLARGVRDVLDNKPYKTEKEWYRAIFHFTADTRFQDMITEQMEAYEEAGIGNFYKDAIQHFGGLDKAMKLIIYEYDGSDYFAKDTKIKNFSGLIVSHCLMEMVHHSSELKYQKK